LWKQHSSPSNGSYYAGVAVDSIGNIYISGITNRDGLITKYDSSGNQQWIQEFDNGLDFNDYDVESGIDLAVDSTNSVYVLGYSMLFPTYFGSQSILVIKYDSSGYRVGTKFSDLTSPSSLPVGTGIVAYDIAVTSPNNFYLTGYNLTSEGSRTPFVAKYS
jgi:hypothetical protein